MLLGRKRRLPFPWNDTRSGLLVLAIAQIPSGAPRKSIGGSVNYGCEVMARSGVKFDLGNLHAETML